MKSIFKQNPIQDLVLQISDSLSIKKEQKKQDALIRKANENDQCIICNGALEYSGNGKWHCPKCSGDY